MTRQHAELGYAVLGVLIWPTRRRLWLSAYLWTQSVTTVADRRHIRSADSIDRCSKNQD